MGSHQFLRHARNYVTASALSGVIAFGSVAVLTRLLTPAEYGIVSVFLSIVSVFSLLLELNYRGAVNRYYLERTTDFPHFLATSLLFLAGLTALNLLWIWLFRETLSGFFRISPTVFYAGVLCAAAQIPWNLNWKILVAQQRSAPYARLSVLRDALVFAAGAGAVLLLTVGVDPLGWLSADPACAPGVTPGDELVCGREMGQIGGMLLVTLAFATWLGIRLGRIAAGGRFVKKHLVYALAFGVPLLPHSLASYLLNFFDRIIVNQLKGEHATGLYAFAYNVGMAMRLVVNAMNQAWLPIFTDLRDRKRYDEIQRVVTDYTRYVLVIALVLVLFAREVATVLADSRYESALPLVPVIVFGYVMVFFYTLCANHSFYLRKTWYISLATLLAGAANVGLNYWLIPIYGFGAAAWTTLASYVLLFVLHLFIAQVVLHEQVVRLGRPLIWLVVAGLVATGYMLGERALDSYLLSLVLLKLPILAAMGLWLWLARRSAARRAS